MAGSQKEPSTVHPFTDPILAARLEAIKQLAGGSSDRVAVLDRDFNVIYANESAWSEDASRLHDAIQAAFQDPGELLSRLQSLWAVFQSEDRELRHGVLSGLPAGCGKTMWARLKFNGPHVWDNG